MALKFVKAWISISSKIAKETILSKIINTVHMFSIDIANKNFDDNQKKYINTILKLDDSKTIILETRGEDIEVKNIGTITIEEGQTINLEYSAILEDTVEEFFINYSYVDDIPVNTIFTFWESDLQLQLTHKSTVVSTLTCLVGGTVSTGQKIYFKNYEPKISFLSERDKKNIIRGIQSGVNVLSIGSLKIQKDVEDMRKFLADNNGKGMKLYARLSQKMIKKWADHILHDVDGVVLHHDDWATLEGEDDFIDSVKNVGKPLIVVLNESDIVHNDSMKKNLQHYIQLGVDMITISENFLTEQESPLEEIQYVFRELDKAEEEILDTPIIRDAIYLSDKGIDENNYLINLLPQIVHDTKAKIVLCYTTHGVTSSKISALGMHIPLLVFTRDDFSYRYNNLLRWVKWYKIWQTSNYDTFKQIWKEMIRIYFKGNIALDDKVIIINILEDDRESVMDWLINGIEIYKFKNI